MIYKITKAQQIKDIIEPIPSNKFCMYFFGHCRSNPANNQINKDFLPIDNGSSCFLGHIHRYFKPEDIKATGDRNGYGANQLIIRFFHEKYKTFVNATSINDALNINVFYTEPIIKDRIMHLLNDMIEAGY
jgi:hypothetical protein